MSGPDDEPDDTAPSQESSEQRRRRRAAVFGEVLPDSTSDERDAGGSEPERPGDTDDWLRRQVPPHHG